MDHDPPTPSRIATGPPTGPLNGNDPAAYPRIHCVSSGTSLFGSNADSLLFAPTLGGCHLDNSVFKHFKKAAKTVGRDDLSAHDLRRFAGSKNARVARLTENMKRLGHKAVDAVLRYQHSQDGRDAIVAAALSANALAELAAAAEQSDA